MLEVKPTDQRGHKKSQEVTEGSLSPKTIRRQYLENQAT